MKETLPMVKTTNQKVSLLNQKKSNTEIIKFFPKASFKVTQLIKTITTRCKCNAIESLNLKENLK